MSFRVLPPTSMAPESGTRETAPENPTSLRLVIWLAVLATSVATAPPDGGTAALVKVRSPSPPETQTTIPLLTMEASRASVIGSSSR